MSATPLPVDTPGETLFSTVGYALAVLILLAGLVLALIWFPFPRPKRRLRLWRGREERQHVGATEGWSPNDEYALIEPQQDDEYSPRHAVDEPADLPAYLYREIAEHTGVLPDSAGEETRAIVADRWRRTEDEPSDDDDTSGSEQ